MRINIASQTGEFVVGTPGDISVAIHAQAAGGVEDDPIPNGRLSGANPTGGGGHDFTARNVVLARTATYFLVVSAPDAPNDGNDNIYSIGYTLSTSQAGSSGWSIGDRYYFKENDATFIEDTGILTYVQHFAIVAEPLGAGTVPMPDALSLAETGANASGEYTLTLNTEPTADVVITPTIAPSGVAETAVAETARASLTFTTSNWSTAQTITVTAIDDSIDNEGDASTATITHAITTTDADYAALTGSALPSVQVTVADDDASGITASKTALAISETGTGSSGEYTLVLDSEPTAEVVITPTIASSGSGVAVLSTMTLTFTAANWNTPSTITVTAIDDSIDNEGDARTAMITHAVTTTDANYAALSGTALPQVSVIVADDDTAMRLKLRVFLESALP